MIVAERTKLPALEEQASTLTQRIGTLKWQIDEMANFYSADQVRAWRKQRTSLSSKLKTVKREIKTLTDKINGAA